MRKLILTIALVVAAMHAKAQQLTYEHYMQSVLNNNTAVVARSLDIDIAQANLKSSKVFNDPVLSVEYGNNEDWDKKLGQSIAAQLSRTFTFGVRKATIRLAKNELNAMKAVFNDYMRNFNADATVAYLNHLKAKSLLNIALERENYMAQLAQNDSLRFVRGEIAKTVWVETRLAAGLAHNERLAAESEQRNTSIVLGYYMGNLADAQSIVVNGNLENCAFQLRPIGEYIDNALANRADLAAAINNVDVAQAQKQLNSARRRVDLQLSVGAEYNQGAHREEPGEPSFTKLKVGAAIPLKFSNINGGARAMDRARVQQAEQQLADVRMHVQSEVMQAYNNCQIAEQQVKTFTRGLLQETAELLSAKRTAYRAGEISFVEFIETERSENMMQTEYIETLYNRAVSLVELQKSVGISFVNKEQE